MAVVSRGARGDDTEGEDGGWVFGSVHDVPAACFVDLNVAV